MRIEREIVEEEINTEEDLIIAVDAVVFKKSVKCSNIVSENYRRNINAGNIDARHINAWNIDAGNITAWDIDAGNIIARHINAGNIDARHINAGNITAWDINAGNIDAVDIDAWNINAGNIDADFIVCEERKKKTNTAKTTCRNMITKRSTYKKKRVNEK